MASINSNIRGKKLFKSGSSDQAATKGGDGEITISSEKNQQFANANWRLRDAKADCSVTNTTITSAAKRATKNT